MKKLILPILMLLFFAKGANAQCLAYYTYKTDSTLKGHFKDSSYFPGSSHKYYSWNFGDSTTGTGDTISHTFPRAGTYDVCEYIYDSLKTCSTHHCFLVTVGSTPCNARFTVDSIDTTSKIIYITNRSTGGTYDIWTFGDGDTSGLSTPTHTYGSTGSYTLCLYVHCSGGWATPFCDTINGASTRIRSGKGYTLKIKAASSTGTHNIQVASALLKVYPNPVNNTLNVVLPTNVSKGTLSVKNILGQQMTSEEIAAPTTALNMSTFPVGIYLIQVQTTQGMFTTRIIKQ